MNHSEAIREIMVRHNISLVELGKRLGITHAGVTNRLNSQTGLLDTTLQMLEAMGYEIVVRPRTEGDLPEGEYILRFRDYPHIKSKKDELL